MMGQGLEKIRDYFIGYFTVALGGFLSGAIANTFLQSLVFQIFGYQEGWFRRFAPLLFIPAIVLLLYVVALSFFTSTLRFVIATLLAIPTCIIFILSKMYFVNMEYPGIEFTSLWTLVAQIAGTVSVGCWILF